VHSVATGRFRNWNFTDRFPAMNPTRGWSRRDPQRPDDAGKRNDGFLILKQPVDSPYRGGPHRPELISILLLRPPRNPRPHSLLTNVCIARYGATFPLLRRNPKTKQNKGFIPSFEVYVSRRAAFERNAVETLASGSHERNREDVCSTDSTPRYGLVDERYLVLGNLDCFRRLPPFGQKIFLWWQGIKHYRPLCLRASGGTPIFLGVYVIAKRHSRFAFGHIPDAHIRRNYGPTAGV
jgi:hypothetical protein